MQEPLLSEQGRSRLTKRRWWCVLSVLLLLSIAVVAAALFVLLVWHLEPCVNCGGPVPRCTAGTGAEFPRSSSASNLTIPYNFFVTDRAFEGATKEVWENNFAAFPDFFNLTNFVFNDDASMSCSAKRIGRELSEAGVVENAYEAFLNLRPPAFRADLWRYMMLWSHGGVYADSKMMLRMDPREWIDFERDTLVLVKDRVFGYWNAMMAAKPRSFALEETLRLVVKNVLAHLYPHSVLQITGPKALAMAIGLSTVGCHGGYCSWTCPTNLSSAVLAHEVPRIQSYFNGSFVKDSCTGSVIGQSNVEVHRNDKSSKAGYYNLYYYHEVYCDEPGPALCPNVCPDS